MPKKYELAVVIGRFQPFHLGHDALITEAFRQADNVLVLIGSAFQARDPRNPFTYEEREEMITNALPQYFEDDTDQRLWFAPLRDYFYEDNKWIKQVQQTIQDNCHQMGLHGTGAKVCLVGHDKDHTTYYLKWFPSYDFVNADKFVEMGERPIDATQIRTLMFNRQYRLVAGALHEPTNQWMTEHYFGSPEFEHTLEEYNFIQRYKEQWRAAPYPVTFCTVDAVLLQGGHVLLIKRKSAPGKGLWALPGGYLNQKETHRQGMIRELKEETAVKVPVPVLEANITHQQVFDHPDRSLRGRTITNAFLIELPGPPDGKLPKVKGMDDAEAAKWFPVSEALEMSDQLFEDHHSIISMLTARAK
jgi:bifunctional NMN adenylyltransferase/nudix hydrolase